MLAGMFAMMGGVPAGPVPTAFFSDDPMLSTAWGQVTYPAAVHVAASSKTYVCWQFVGLAGCKGVHAAAYDHASGTWGERYAVGNFLLADDDHGDAVLLRDASGYLHCFYGSHHNGQKWAVTNSPDDISAWTQQPDIGSAATYPKPALVGSTIYLFVRNSSITTRMRMAVATMTPVAGVGTWTSFTNIIDFDANSRVYTAEAHVVGTKIHFVCSRANDTDTERKGVYYFVYDTVSGAVENYDASFSVASGSLPVTLAQANASFRIYDHGANDGDLGSFQFDTSGNPHIIFADGSTPNYDLKHMMLSGGTWTAPVTVAPLKDWYVTLGFVDNYALVPGASGAMEAWYNASNGDKIRRVRSAAGSWAAAKVIKAAGALPLLQATAVKDADPSLRALFAESSGGSADSGAANLSLFAYGDGGAVNATIDVAPIDPSWDDVTLLLGANHRNNAVNIVDESRSSLRVSLFGNAKADTSQTPFAGRASIRLDGTGDYLTAINNAAYSVAGAGDFKIDFWLRPNETGRDQTLISKRSITATPGEFQSSMTSANKVNLLMWSSGALVLNIATTSSLAAGAWYFVEISRTAGVTRLFLDGALEASGTQSAAPGTSAQPLHIGRDPTVTTRDLNGWLGEVRFTKAAGNTAAYTRPIAPHPRR